MPREQAPETAADIRIDNEGPNRSVRRPSGAATKAPEPRLTAIASPIADRLIPRSARNRTLSAPIRNDGSVATTVIAKLRPTTLAGCTRPARRKFKVDLFSLVVVDPIRIRTRPRSAAPAPQSPRTGSRVLNPNPGHSRIATGAAVSKARRLMAPTSPMLSRRIAAHLT